MVLAARSAVRCQRCSACCFSRAVVIRCGERTVLKPADLLCPYLSFDGDRAVCTVYDEPWFARLPCHGADPNLHSRAAGHAACGLGRLLASSPTLQTDLGRAPWARLETLEELGAWDPEARHG